jgi:glycosyltransferase involved in cell wall biosynthesis
MKYNLPEKYILFLGNQSHRKNPHRAVEAYVRYSAQCDHPLPLVTPGLSEKFIGRTLRRLGAAYDPNLFITPGYISEADLPLVYSMSTLFLFPSLSEGFGMPVIEAMACGVPVITSAISSLPEIAGHAAMLTDPLDTQTLTAAILKLSSDESLRRQKIEEGFTNVKRFSWDRSAERVLSLYEEVYLQSRAFNRAYT